jgi:predicted transcriptional regulator of viral defense system
MPTNDATTKAREAFLARGGVLRTSQALRAGIHPQTLYAMRDAGLLERVSRGLYRLADLPALSDPDLVPVGLRVPGGVICLISALSFHELTTEIPHEVYLALKRGAEPPRLGYPPVRVFWFSGAAFTEGIETHLVDGIALRVYSPEKTIADCLKYRHKLGLDVALEALKLYRSRGRMKIEELLRCARICRVERIMRPYLEVLL